MEQVWLSGANWEGYAGAWYTVHFYYSLRVLVLDHHWPCLRLPPDFLRPADFWRNAAYSLTLIAHESLFL
ncbi:MAG: hypothetical protein IPH82_27765 [Chloroflexi bacterium]|nr:hypothetical protein [Chloroflexota bacterium]